MAPSLVVHSRMSVSWRPTRARLSVLLLASLALVPAGPAAAQAVDDPYPAEPGGGLAVERPMDLTWEEVVPLPQPTWQDPRWYKRPPRYGEPVDPVELEPIVPVEPAPPFEPQPGDPQPVGGPHLDAALADAALRTGLDPSAIAVLRSEEVEWSDGSLGCPEPGMYYTQALVPGWLVQLDAGGQVLEYHADRSGSRLVACDQPEAPLPPAEELY